MPKIRTLRPTGTGLGEALDDESRIVPNTLAVLARILDSGEGRVLESDDGFTWFFGRLAMHVAAVDLGEQIEMSSRIVVVEGMQEVNIDLLDRLNDVNGQAAGWNFWINPESDEIVSTISYPLSQRRWWWTACFLEALTLQATVAECIADELAALAGGQAAIRQHPGRIGLTGVDAQLREALYTNRSPTASLNYYYTDHDRHRIFVALEELLPGFEVEASVEALVLTLTPDGAPSPLTRAGTYWHPEYGWGLQIATMGVPEDESDMQSREELLLLAAESNTERGLEASAVPTFGGWVLVDGFGVIHHSFIRAESASAIAGIAADTLGDVLALIFSELVETFGSLQDQASQLTTGAVLIGQRVGPTGWSYLLDADNQPERSLETSSNDPEDPYDEIWLRPRHACICSFGVFNPSGPTVMSLETGIRGDTEELFFVLRHPFVPKIDSLGTFPQGDLEALKNLIIEAFSSTTAPVVSTDSINWLDNFYPILELPIVEGLRQFAESSSDFDFGGAGDRLIDFGCLPWVRLVAESDLERSVAADSYPIAHWLSALTDPEVIKGHQLFLESAWLGACSFLAEGEFAAQTVANECQERVKKRLVFEETFRESKRPSG